VKDILIRLRGPLIAIVALALSSSLAFGAEPSSSPGANGRANAQEHGGQAGASGDEETAGDEDTEEPEATEGTEEETGDSADNCLTDPTGLTEEELAAMSHGSIVCWAAHQTTWPEEFKNHGAFVSSWAHSGKGGNGHANQNSQNKGPKD
jgi:hypothetical protein